MRKMYEAIYQEFGKKKCENQRFQDKKHLVQQVKLPMLAQSQSSSQSTNSFKSLERSGCRSRCVPDLIQNEASKPFNSCSRFWWRRSSRNHQMFKYNSRDCNFKKSYNICGELVCKLKHLICWWGFQKNLSRRNFFNNFQARTISRQVFVDQRRCVT